MQLEAIPVGLKTNFFILVKRILFDSKALKNISIFFLIRPKQSSFYKIINFVFNCMVYATNLAYPIFSCLSIDYVYRKYIKHGDSTKLNNKPKSIKSNNETKSIKKKVDDINIRIQSTNKDIDNKKSHDECGVDSRFVHWVRAKPVKPEYRPKGKWRKSDFKSKFNDKLRCTILDKGDLLLEKYLKKLDIPVLLPMYKITYCNTTSKKDIPKDLNDTLNKIIDKIVGEGGRRRSPTNKKLVDQLIDNAVGISHIEPELLLKGRIPPTSPISFKKSTLRLIPHLKKYGLYY
ncbi:hypothetical protein K502DRAFT_346463 [Neoconidiobolus thromboides FSU 785]|nr:hypothetical protein K502DRAFT_346463 [Neoconidiobolus thromboides FSU 785]